MNTLFPGNLCKKAVCSAVILLLLTCCGNNSGTPAGINKLYNDIDRILEKYDSREGNTHMFSRREKCLADLAGRDTVKKIAEIGFNAGHSTITLLYNNPSAELWSFDLCTHDYYRECMEYIRNAFGKRVHIICGNSNVTVPQFRRKNPGLTFDLIHIDGGHLGDIPKHDIINMLKMSRADTYILVDDCNCVEKSKHDGWIGTDVNRAWDYAEGMKLLQRVRYPGCNIGNCLGKPVPHN